jgi:phenylacetate-CoA ligase
MIYKILFSIGQYFRNPSLQKQLLFLKSSQNWSFAKLEAYQLQKLQELVTIAYHHSIFYKNTFDRVGLKPSDIKSLDDLRKIPMVTKTDLIQFNQDIHTSIHHKKKFKAVTSGTSGASLTFYKDEFADSFNRASIFRGYSWYNVLPWERNVYFWGYQFTLWSKLKTVFLDTLQNRFRLFKFSSTTIEKVLPKLKNVAYIHGYSSMIYEIAKKYNSLHKGEFKKLKMIKGTSEKVFDSYQEEVVKAFGLPIINEYGAAETGIIAFECPHKTIHINMEGVIVEEVANEIVITNLQQTSFPIIRYKLGDYIRLNKNTTNCACGMKHAAISEITGRIGKVVFGKTTQYPSLYFYYIFKNLGNKYQLYLNYQVHQHKKGYLIFLIEQDITVKESNLISQEIKIYFENDIDFEIFSNQQFSSTQKKQESFISTLI